MMAWYILSKTLLRLVSILSFFCRLDQRTVFLATAVEMQAPWLLPVFPLHPPKKLKVNGTSNSTDSGKLIPRHLWIAVRNSSEELNYQIAPLFKRNPLWAQHVWGNPEKDSFMRDVFNGTSLLWAYDIISPWAGAARADIWRYAVLWTYGGAYVDDDSDINTPLDKVIEPLDELIVSYEVIASEYRKDLSPALRDLMHAPYWQIIMCSTGPSVLTASARDIMLENPKVTLKLAREDWRDYGGKFKAVYIPVRQQAGHYMNKLKGSFDSKFLLSYMEEKGVTDADIKSWEGQPVQGQNDKQIFVVRGGKKRGIPSWDTLLAMNISMADVWVMSDDKVRTIPTGEQLPALDFSYD